MGKLARLTAIRSDIQDTPKRCGKCGALGATIGIVCPACGASGAELCSKCWRLVADDLDLVQKQLDDQRGDAQ